MKQSRLPQLALLIATLLASWLGMQAIHELGHVLGAVLGGGRIERVVLHPLTISRTDLASDPRPLLTVWAGPIFGVLLPLALWGIAVRTRMPCSFLVRFFAGFCLIANGAYLLGGSFDGIGDCGVMLRHGSPIWTLWLFGVVTIPAGLALWHKQGPHFGLGDAKGKVDPRAAVAAVVAAVLFLLLGLLVGG
jgi:hypothetical protein